MEYKIVSGLFDTFLLLRFDGKKYTVVSSFLTELEASQYRDKIDRIYNEYGVIVN